MASAQDIIQGLKNVTDTLNAAQPEAENLTALNVGGLTLGYGPWTTVIKSLQQAILITSAQSGALSYSKENIESSGPEILKAFQAYTMVSEQLLNTLIGKAGIKATVQFVGPPLAAALRALEGSDDMIAFALADKLPGQAADLKALAARTDDVQAKAVAAWS